MACDFIVQLSKLRKLSAESIENTNVFDRFKQYLHVERQVESELRELLRKVNKSQKKCLVLLCGSAGDGKSHLISYLKNSDTEGLLNNYKLYNDATESSGPTLTSMDTLAQRLSPFNDENCFDHEDDKMIIAINLGTLNNFIESSQGNNFSMLKEYVETNKIFSGYFQGNGYSENSFFQHVSFSDYQVFSLEEKGIETAFLERLFDKIFRQSDDNPFYKEYMKNVGCSNCKRCPVRHNYEFLSEQKHQKAVIRRIVETVIKDKAFVSTREVLNLLYDLIVHPDFNVKKINVGVSDVNYLTDYINWSTPMLLNEFEDISPLLNMIGKHDILKERNDRSDYDATRFHAMENIQEVFINVTEGTPFQILYNLTDVSVLGGIKPELKKIIYRFLVRLEDLDVNNKFGKSQQRLEEFIHYLYAQNSGNELKLKKLYEIAKKAVFSWDGKFGDDYICVDGSSEQIWILEQLYLKSAINRDVPLISGSIQRFFPTIKIRFQKESSTQDDMAELSIDFALYELLSDMGEGYRPTVQDKNRHTDFVSFVQQVTKFGNKSSKIIMIPKENDKKYEMIFKTTEFGFEFKVVG